MKYALVTGGSRGIGRAICKKLSTMGYYVLINCNKGTDAAQQTLEEIDKNGGMGEIMAFDVSNPNAVEAVLEAWQASHEDGYIEVLVNNAGIRHDNIMALMPHDDWNSVINTNLGGFFNVTQTLLQPMIRHKYGRIISIASVSGLKGLPGQTNYSAAKAGIIAATKALAQEVARKNVTVNCVAPGFINTDMTADLDRDTLSQTIPAHRFGTPEEVAHLVGFLASKEAGYITGETISINGGLYT